MTKSDSARALLIVGAGPTGLTAAVELARRGIAARVVDRREGPTPLSKAVGISSHSLDILEPSGVTERLLAEGIRVRHVHIHFEGRKLGLIRFRGLAHRFAFLLALPQSDTEGTMVDVLKGFGGSVEWRTAFSALRQAGEEVEVTLEGPNGREEARYSHVLGADGVRSAVREALGMSFDGHTHARTWSIADAELDDWPYEPEAANVFFHGDGDIGFIVPIGTRRFRAVSNTEDALAHVPGNYRISRLLRSDTFGIPVRQAASYQAGGVFLAGDAAHVHSPVGGRGMNLGIEDAASFARRFAEGTLDGYTAERHPIGARWIAFSERALSVAQAANPGIIAMRNLGIRIASHMPPLQQPVLNRIAGLTE